MNSISKILVGARKRACAGNKALIGTYQMLRGFGLLDQALWKSYLSMTGLKKLHIGCGSNILHGWLNTDYFPINKLVIHLDATKKFRLPDQAFDYIFSEHMIEHITLDDGLQMLKECWRVLRPGGKIRITTPSLEFVCGLVVWDRSEDHEKYINWSNRGQNFPTSLNAACVVANTLMRNWGHTFIYDKTTLIGALQFAGFVDIQQQSVLQSADTNLQGLENTGRMPEGIIEA